MPSRKVQRFRVAKVQSKKGYHNLLIWQKSKELIILVYKITEKFPKSELYGITSQIRRAVISVALNIAEGDRRRSRKEFLRFLDMADASLVELEASFEISLELGVVSKKDCSLVEGKRRELAVMLAAFIKSVKKQV